MVLDLPPSLKLNELEWAAGVAISPLTHTVMKSPALSAASKERLKTLF